MTHTLIVYFGSKHKNQQRKIAKLLNAIYAQSFKKSSNSQTMTANMATESPNSKPSCEMGVGLLDAFEYLNLSAGCLHLLKKFTIIITCFVIASTDLGEYSRWENTQQSDNYPLEMSWKHLKLLLDYYFRLAYPHKNLKCQNDKLRHYNSNRC